LIATLVRK